VRRGRRNRSPDQRDRERGDEHGEDHGAQAQPRHGQSEAGCEVVAEGDHVQVPRQCPRDHGAEGDERERAQAGRQRGLHEAALAPEEQPTRALLVEEDHDGRHRGQRQGHRDAGEHEPGGGRT
jgi:hypothetical protein